MWDLTVPGNNDHDFYVIPVQPVSHNTYNSIVGTTAILVHNCSKNQGIYEFADQSNPGTTYVGKTVNFANRLADHVANGRLASIEDAVCTHVCGGDDDLFVAEHLRMQELVDQGVSLSNEIASPGKAILQARQAAQIWEQLPLWEG
jgi:hypothetical protein